MKKNYDLDKIKAEYPMTWVIEILGGDVHQSLSGGWSATKCPGHDDRRASASISPGDDYIVCHTCGLRGDIFDVIKELVPKVRSLPEAIQWLDRKFGQMKSTPDNS